MSDTNTHKVYAVYHQGELLYVGCTSDVEARMRAHGYAKKFGDKEVSSKILSEHSDRSEALMNESAKIKELHPPLNGVPNENLKPRSGLKSLRIDPVVHYNLRLMANDRGTSITNEAEDAICYFLAEHRAQMRKGPKLNRKAKGQ